MGTPAFAVPSLRMLIAEGYEIAGVFCQPDRPSGRGNKLTSCPVKQLALEAGLPVFQPERIRLDGAEALSSLRPDLCVTAAFGQILSKENLAAPRLGTVNVHASLLPKYRGSAPINWALINGEKTTGVTTMLTDEGLDTGDILLRQPYEIPDGMTAGELTEALAEVGAQLLKRTLPALLAGTCPREKQNEAEMTYFPMLKKETGHIDLTKDAAKIVDLIRGVSPWPGAFAFAGQDTVKIWKAAPAARPASGRGPGAVLCADLKNGLILEAGNGTALSVEELQLPGGKRMKTADYLRGHSFPYERLT